MRVTGTLYIARLLELSMYQSVHTLGGMAGTYRYPERHYLCHTINDETFVNDASLHFVLFLQTNQSVHNRIVLRTSCCTHVVRAAFTYDEGGC